MTTTTAGSADAVRVDLRCPIPGPGFGCRERMGKLLARAVHYGEPAHVLAAGMVEVGCDNCARAERAAGRPCARVLHRFNLLGELVATEIVPTGGTA